MSMDMPGGYMNGLPKRHIDPGYAVWMQQRGLDPNKPFTGQRSIADIRQEIAVDNARWSPGIAGEESALTPLEIAETNEQQRLYGPGSPYYEQVGATRAGGIGSLGLTADTAATQRARDYWRPMTIAESRARNAALNPLPPYVPQQGVPKSPAGDADTQGASMSSIPATFQAEQELQKLRRQRELYDTMRLGVPHNHEIRNAVAEEMRRRGHSDEEIRSYRVSGAEADAQAALRRRETDSAVGQPGAPNPQQYGTAVAVLGPDGKPLPDPQREQAVQARIARAMNGEGMAPGPGSGTLTPEQMEYEEARKRAEQSGRTALMNPDVKLRIPGYDYGHKPLTVVKPGDEGSFSMVPNIPREAWFRGQPLLSGTLLTGEVDSEIYRLARESGMSVEEATAAYESVREARGKRKQSGGSAPAPESGTLDPASQPTVRNADGTVSTVRTIGIEVDGKHVLIPTVSPDGKVLTDEQAIEMFRSSGKHLGVFNSREESDAAGRALSQHEARRVGSSGTLTPEQMQQMSSPSPDARRYDGLNYKSNRVVGQSRAVSGGMAGNFVGDRQRQAISQMTSMANRMAEGRGGEPMRQGVAALEMAIQSGDTSAIESAEANLRTLLSPMLDKFDARFRGEVGDIGIDVRDQFMQTLKARIQAGTAGLNRGMPMQPQASAGTGGPRPPAPQRPGAGGQSAPQQPVRTPAGLSVHDFGSMDEAMTSSAKGGTIKSGDLVRIAGSAFTAVPSFDQYGNPEWGFAPAVVFGGGSTGSPEIAIPDPFDGKKTADEWGDSLSELQRQTMIDSLLTNPSMRSSLDRDTLNRIDAIRRSRQGLLRSPMSPRDRETAMARLKSEENAALHAAMASVSSKARGSALSASDYAEQQRARAQEDAQIKSDMELDKSIRLAEANAILSEQQAEAKVVRDAMVKDRERAIAAAEEERKRAAEAERERVANFEVPLSSEAAMAYVESGSLMKAESSPAVASAWNSLDDQQKQLAVDLLTDFAEAAPPPPRMQYRSRGGKGLEGEQDLTSMEDAPPVTVQSAINPDAHLPERDLVRLFESIRDMPTPPSATTQQTDPDDPTKEFEQSSMTARKDYEAKMSEWQQGVQKILMQDRPPQYSAEYYRQNPDAVTMVQSRFNDWDAKVFRPAVAAATESKDPAQLREALGDLYSWVVVMENAGLPTNYQNYQGIDMNNGREAFVRSVMKAMPASN